MTPLMEEVREMIGDRPVYLSFDIDSLDPAFAPGTGTFLLMTCETTVKHLLTPKRSRIKG